MARRVGFGDSDERQSERAAARKAEKARRRQAAYSAQDERLARRRDADAPAPDASAGKAGRAGRLFVGLFLAVWLCGWTAGIVFALGAMMNEGFSGGGLFLIVWLGLAVVGWVFAVRMLLRLIRGEPLRRRRPGRRPFSPMRQTTGDFHSGGEDRF